MSWTVARFRDAASVSSPEARSSVLSVDDLKTFISGLIVRETITSQARTAGIERDPAFIAARSKNLESWLYEKAYGEAVASMHVSDDTIRAYYERYTDEFLMPARVHVREILVASREESLQVGIELESHPFAEVATQFSIRPESETSGGYLGAFTREQLGTLAGLVFDGKENDIIGPVELQGKFAYFHVGPHEISRRANLEEVRSDIEIIVRQTKKQDFLRDLVAGLRGRYAVEIYADRLGPVQLVSHENS